MTSYSAKNPIPALGGFNPDYYAETASIAPGSPASRPSRPSQPRPQQQQQQQQQQQLNAYPPRPHSSSGAYAQQQNYPPPSSGYGQNLAPPPQQYGPPRPSQNNEAPPSKPPRPVSWSGSGGSSSNNASNSPAGPKLSLTERLGAPINKLANKLGSEAFLPSPLDQECDKAARILQSFCKDGFYNNTSQSPSPSSPSPRRSPTSPSPLLTIPSSVIASASGLAIFTVLRTGFQISGSSGSGIVVARLPSSGRWSPPSGIQIHSLGAGFLAGLDIYDCVCVLRTPEAVRAFTRPGNRVSLGGEIGLAAGPMGVGGGVDAALGGGGGKGKKEGGGGNKPVWSYIKSRGLYAGLQADGTVITARDEANKVFYGRRLTVEQILRGDVPRVVGDGRDGSKWPGGATRLVETLRAAEGGKVKQIGSGSRSADRGVQEYSDEDDDYDKGSRREREREKPRDRRDGRDRR